MNPEDLQKFTGNRSLPPESLATPILRELSALLVDAGNDGIDKHPARTLQKMMFDTVADPYLTPEEKWVRLLQKEPVRGMVAGQYREYELTGDRQYQVFLLCSLALFVAQPQLRKQPDVIAKIQDVWSSYAEASEVGDQRPRRTHDVQGRPIDIKSEERWRNIQRERLPQFLSITQRLIDIVRAPWQSHDMYAYFSKYIPELKNLH